MHPGTPITGVTSGTFTIPTSGHDFSGNHALPHHADRHRLRRPAVDEVRDRLPGEGQSHLRHRAERAHALPRRHRAHGAVRLRHADRLQPHHRGAQPDRRRPTLHLRLVVGRRCAAAHHRCSRRHQPTRQPTLRSPPGSACRRLSFNETRGRQRPMHQGTATRARSARPDLFAAGQVRNALGFDGSTTL